MLNEILLDRILLQFWSYFNGICTIEIFLFLLRQLTYSNSFIYLATTTGLSH